jgi:hypothetical protein
MHTYIGVQKDPEAEVSSGTGVVFCFWTAGQGIGHACVSEAARCVCNAKQRFCVLRVGVLSKLMHTYIGVQKDLRVLLIREMVQRSLRVLFTHSWCGQNWGTPTFECGESGVLLEKCLEPRCQHLACPLAWAAMPGNAIRHCQA